MALHQDVGGTVAPAGFQSVGEAAIRCCFESADGQRWTGHVTAESLKATTIMGRHRNVGV
jgi:hypothetical protein